MTLLTIAELLSGETHLSFGGLVDSETAFGWEQVHWNEWVDETLTAGAEAAVAASAIR